LKDGAGGRSGLNSGQGIIDVASIVAVFKYAEFIVQYFEGKFGLSTRYDMTNTVTMKIALKIKIYIIIFLQDIYEIAKRYNTERINIIMGQAEQ